MSTKKTYIQEVTALITGKDAKAIGEKIQKQMSGGLKAQIAIKDAATYDFENAVENAKEAVIISLMNNGKEVSDRDASIQGYLDAKAALVKAEKNLKDHQTTIEWLKEGQDTVNN